jgi:GTP cyclohydrolase II
MKAMQYSRVEKIAEASLPTRWGNFRIMGFEGHLSPTSTPGPQGKLIEEVVVLIYGELDAQPPIIRIHSQCLTGDVFHSLRCDCRQQLELALDTITAHGSGILLYEAQEGRGIGLMAKLRAYQLQDAGLDTIEANEQLGFQADHRDFSLPAEVLRQLGIPAVRLITNNPEKVQALESHGIRVTERISAEVAAELTNESYLQVKRDKMGHLFGSLPHELSRSS